jgi:hypothetical protein
MNTFNVFLENRYVGRVLATDHAHAVRLGRFMLGRRARETSLVYAEPAGD